jgi:ycfA family protein
VVIIRLTPKALKRQLERDGWKNVRTRGSHYIFKHPSKPGLVTVPFHNGDLKPKTLQSILKQAGLL